MNLMSNLFLLVSLARKEQIDTAALSRPAYSFIQA